MEDGHYQRLRRSMAAEEQQFEIKRIDGRLMRVPVVTAETVHETEDDVYDDTGPYDQPPYIEPVAEAAPRHIPVSQPETRSWRPSGVEDARDGGNEIAVSERHRPPVRTLAALALGTFVVGTGVVSYGVNYAGSYAFTKWDMEVSLPQHVIGTIEYFSEKSGE